MGGALAMTGVAVLMMLVALAVWSDSKVAGAAPWLTVTDAVVGVVFVVAGTVAGGPRRERALVATVGAVWLAGSVLPVARTGHQTVLAVALICFPTGRVRGVVQGVLVVLAVPVAFGIGGQPAAAALFAAVAVAAWADGHATKPTRGYPTAAAAVVAACLAGAFVVSRRWSAQFEPQAALFGYELVLVLVALSFPFGARFAVRARAGLAERVVSPLRWSGLEGLTAVLGAVLGDPELRIHPARGAPEPISHDGRRVLNVAGDDGRPVAVVVHRSAALDEPRVADAFATAVRLAVTHLGLQEEQRRQLRELTAARVRLLAAGDRQRERIAAELRETADVALHTALMHVEAQRPGPPDPQVRTALDIVAGELRAAACDLADLVAGVAPVALGGGRLRQALDGLARSSPVPATVDFAADTAGDREAEAALFYVCSEAVANAAKHAGAALISISVRRQGAELVAQVHDDGRGGADPAGSGLQGLADRVATCGGRLWVDSPPGAGTMVRAALPAVSRSAGRA